MKLMIVFSMLLFVTALLGCNNSPQAGGSSEETNAIAGILVDSKGKAIANAWVEVRPTTDQYQPTVVMKTNVGALRMAAATMSYRDTTDASGRWSIQSDIPGEYTILAGDSTGRKILRKVYLQKDMEIQDTLLPSVSFKTTISCRWSLPQGVLAVIPGTMLHASADSAGTIRFDSLPQGDLDMKVLSGDAFRYEDIQVVLRLDPAQETRIWGPYSSNEMLDSANRTIVQSKATELPLDTLTLPLRYDYGVRGWWNLDQMLEKDGFQFFQDSKSRAEQGVIYGGSLETGVFNKGLHLNGALEFGVVESAGSVFDSVGAFSVELWFNLQSIPEGESYQRNLFGQMGFAGEESADVFSIALVKDAEQKPVVGFLLSDGVTGTLDSTALVRSNVAIDTSKWNYVVATWDGSKACLMVNAEAMVCKQLFIEQISKSTESLYFGKEDLNVILDEIRIIDINMDQNDARYRWLRRLQ